MDEQRFRVIQGDGLASSSLGPLPVSCACGAIELVVPRPDAVKIGDLRCWACRGNAIVDRDPGDETSA